MEIKHTAGPWKVVACNENFEIQTKDDKCLADAWSYAINSNGEEMEANAKLFAAAPDLLEALERCELLLRSKRHACEDSNLCHLLDSHISQARNAINKATA